MKAFITILLLCLLLSPEAIAQKSAPGKTAKEVKAINFRKELKDRQTARRKRAAKAKEEDDKLYKDVDELQQQEKAEKAEIEKAALKRHMAFQSDEVRRRIQKNKKKSSRKFWD